SRRRHTRCLSDWSSDVCSSDLIVLGIALTGLAAEKKSEGKMGKLRHVVAFKFKKETSEEQIKQVEDAFRDLRKKIHEIAGYEWRSEERRVGKEWRSRRTAQRER